MLGRWKEDLFISKGRAYLNFSQGEGGANKLGRKGGGIATRTPLSSITKKEQGVEPLNPWEKKEGKYKIGEDGK